MEHTKKDKSKVNAKIEEQLQKLEGLDDNSQRAVKLTVQQLRYLLINSSNGETAYHKLLQETIDTKERLQAAVEQEHNKTTIQKYKKHIREHMDKIESYIDALELASIDFVERETDIYIKNSESFEDEIIKLAIIKEEYGELEKEYNSLKNTYDNISKELEETRTATTTLKDENENKIKIIEELEKELVSVKEKLISESRKVTDLIEKDNNEIKELQSKLAEETKSRINSEQEMFKMKTREESVLNERDSFKQRAEDLKDQNEHLNSRLEQLETDRTKKEVTISTLTEEKTNLDKEIIRLKNDMNNVERDHEIQLKELNDKNDALDKEIQNNKEKYKETINKLNNFNANLLKEKEENEREYNEKIKGMEEKIKQLESERVYLKENENKLETALKDERERYEKIISEKTKLEIQLQDQGLMNKNQKMKSKKLKKGNE